MSILIFHWRKLKLKLFKLNFQDFFNTEKNQISATTLFRTFAGSMNKKNTVTLKITQRKIYNKNPDQRLCRLCGKESRKFSKIFSKPGKSKYLQHQIFLTIGINISETDNLSDIICRDCERFIESAVSFRNECFKTQHTLSKSCSIKCVISRIEQEHSTTVQNNCIKPTKKRLKFMEHSIVIVQL